MRVELNTQPDTLRSMRNLTLIPYDSIPRSTVPGYRNLHKQHIKETLVNKHKYTNYLTIKKGGHVTSPKDASPVPHKATPRTHPIFALFRRLLRQI